MPSILGFIWYCIRKASKSWYISGPAIVAGIIGLIITNSVLYAVLSAILGVSLALLVLITINILIDIWDKYTWEDP